MDKQRFVLDKPPHPAPDALEFAPAILKSQHQPPSPLPRFVLYALLALAGVMAAWTLLGRLDIVAVAQGKLVPQSFLKVVQPADSGIVREILVKEGDEVAQGQVLMRMDPFLSDADGRALLNEVKLKRLQVRRIDAELDGAAMVRASEDAPGLFTQVEAQHRARNQAHQDALDAERAMLAKAQHDLKGSVEVEAKLGLTAPIYREQERAWEILANEGFAGRLMVLERQKNRIENEQNLRAQEYNLARELWRKALLKSPAAVVSIEIASDGILSIRTRRGEWVEYDVCCDTCVLWFLTVLNLKRAVNGRRLSVAILPDAIDAEQFRKLRVWLRWKDKGEAPAT